MNSRALAKFIHEKMIEKNLSTYDVARRSKDKINANTITRILNGDIKEARLSTLGAIAEGLDVPIIEIVRVATELHEPTNRRELLIESFGGETLDEKYVAAIEDAIEALVSQFKRAQEREKIMDMAVQDAADFVSDATKRLKE